MASSSQGSWLFSLGLMPILMGLGHLAPAIGAINAATGSYQFPVLLLGMIGSAAALVDSVDTYKDIPRSSRPPKWTWRLWIYSLWAIILVCTYHSGLRTAITMYQFSLIGLGWGTPCIPRYSSDGFHLSKPKTLLDAKSIVSAVYMGYVTAGTSMFCFCHSKTAHWNDASLCTRTLCLAVLYQFFRETACDTRDIEEDIKDGMKTLPVRIGKTKTLLLMVVAGILLDSLMTQGVLLTRSRVHIDCVLLIGSVVRVGTTIGVYSWILQYSRANRLAWSTMSLLGLIPVI